MRQRLTVPRGPPARWLAAGLAAAAVVVLACPAPEADAQAAPATAEPFSGTVSAQGARIAVTIPGAPITDTPVDLGGPTAQATLDSLGTSKGYAAFPDPGELVISLPGLVTGLLGSGAAGLPPIALPSLPKYPLYITSDAVTSPEASLGAGPYELVAKSGQTSSEATAGAGLRSSPIGNVGSIRSQASVRVDPTGSVVAEATSVVEGFTLGPFSVGSIRSAASLVRGVDGSTRPASSLAIDLLALGGIAVSVSPTGLDVGDIAVPLPIGPLLSDLLKAFGITLELLPAEQVADGVMSSALRITAPLEAAGLGTAPGKVTITLGSTSARLLGQATEPVLPEAPVEPPSEGILAPTLPSSVDFGAPALGGLPGGTAPSTAGPAPEANAPTEAELQSRLAFDVESLYLTLALLAVAILVTSQVVRLLGVRAPWA